MKRYLLMFVILFSVFTNVNAEQFKVEPEVTEWEENYCSPRARSSDPAILCRLNGGTDGTIFRPCQGADGRFNNAPVMTRILLWAEHKYAISEPVITNFTGYGTGRHSGLCPDTEYNRGVVDVESGVVTVNGVSAIHGGPVERDFTAHRSRDVSCPSGSRFIRGDDGEGPRFKNDGCYVECEEGEILLNGACSVDVREELGCSTNNSDNPCNIATGNKFRSETDFSAQGLSFTRFYNSQALENNGLGMGWQSNYQNSLLVGESSLTVISSNGRGEPWTNVNSQWVGDSDSDVIITQDDSGYVLTKNNNASERYDLDGRLQSQTDTNGSETTYRYDSENNLVEVTNEYGKSISFTYSGGLLASVTDAFGAQYRYAYDESLNLTTIIYPDTTPVDDTDNPRKIYHYENQDYPNHLTGITDENGDRYGNFAYGEDGKVILSELGTTTNSVGQEKVELGFQ